MGQFTSILLNLTLGTFIYANFWAIFLILLNFHPVRLRRPGTQIPAAPRDHPLPGRVRRPVHGQESGGARLRGGDLRDERQWHRKGHESPRG